MPVDVYPSLKTNTLVLVSKIKDGSGPILRCCNAAPFLGRRFSLRDQRRKMGFNPSGFLKTQFAIHRLRPSLIERIVPKKAEQYLL